MRVGWLLLIVAAALAVGSALSVKDESFYFFILPGLLMLAMSIATLLLLPVVAARGLRRQPLMPAWPLVAAALAVATVVVFPVKTHFHDERGACTGAIPFAEHVLARDRATVVLTSECDGDSVQTDVSR